MNSLAVVRSASVAARTVMEACSGVRLGAWSNAVIPLPPTFGARRPPQLYRAAGQPWGGLDGGGGEIYPGGEVFGMAARGGEAGDEGINLVVRGEAGAAQQWTGLIEQAPWPDAATGAGIRVGSALSFGQHIGGLGEGGGADADANEA